MSHGHNHNHAHSHIVTGKNLVFSILLNILVTVAQVAGGLISGSLALLSDALHNFSDVLSLVISYVAHKLSKRRASEKQTFGLKRAELIAAFVNALSLIIVALYLCYEAVLRFSRPVHIEPGLVMWMALLGIAANGLSVFVLRKDAGHNLNMKSAYLHLLTDMLASVAVLAGGILMYFFKWYWIDSALTIGIAIYLVIVGFDLLKQSTGMLMLFTPQHIDINNVVNEVHKITGTCRLHHVHIWHLNDEELHLEAHLECKEDITISQFDALLHEIEQVLIDKFHINHVTIQPEFKKGDSKDIIVQD